MKYRIVYDTRNEEFGFRIEQRDGLFGDWVYADIRAWGPNHFMEFDEAQKMLKRIRLDGRPVSTKSWELARVADWLQQVNDQIEQMTEEAEELKS